MTASFTTGTINEINAATVGQTMAETIRDDVVAHAAWDLVEEFTAGSGTVRWYVYKCLGSANGLGTDFYVIIGRTLASGELRLSFCEAYDSGTHTMSKFPVDYVSGNLFDSSGRHPSTFVLGTTTFANAGNPATPAMINWVPSGTSTKWWLIAAEDMFSVAFSGAATGFFHVGAYTYLGQLGNTLPIQMIGAGQAAGYIARNPAIASQTISSNYNTAMKFNGGGGGSFAAWPYLGFQGPWQYNDKLQNDQRPVAEVGMQMVSLSGTYADYPQVYGLALGKQKRMRQSNNNWPVGIAFGDAFALNGTLWVPYNTTSNDGRIWNTEVAS